MLADEVKYCPRCGAGLIQELKFGKERPCCPSCSWIYFADPRVAAAVLVEREGKVLLVRRAIPPEEGRWTLPAGFIDAGENPARAAERECLEETGLHVHVVALVDVIAALEHARGAHILIVYRAELLSGELHPADDVDRAAFFDRNDLPPLAFRSTKKILS